MDWEGAFLKLEVEVKLLHALKDSLGACGAFGVIVGVDKEVVHVNDEPSFCDHFSERVRHELLEHGGGVCHAEKHDCGFVESSVGDESGLSLVAFLDADVVVPPLYIKLNKDLGVFEFVDEVRDQREGICVSDGVFIEVAIILARSESAILFLDKEEGRCLGGFGQADLSRAKVFINEVVGSLSFFYREGVKFPNLWDKGFVEVDGVIIGAYRGNVVSGFF